MLLVGLTGGVGMGKSTVAEYLSRRGERIIDTDVLARELVSPGTPALTEIRDSFGPSVITEEGALDRSALARLVFGNEENRRKLESILHPRIRVKWQDQAKEWAEEGVSRAVVVIPLLFETGAESEFDVSICVTCSRGTQLQRLRRRGWSDQEISNRISAQHPIETKMERADRVIWTESSVEVSALQAGWIFNRL